MGASESKLVFKKGIFRLSEERNIPAGDPYWTRVRLALYFVFEFYLIHTDTPVKFWELPESTEDVFSLFTPSDIRRTRDQALSNLETLIISAASHLVSLKNHPSFPDPELAPASHALNCIRILTRVLPFIYEVEHLEDWEEKFFWSRRRKDRQSSQGASEILFDEAQPEEQLDGTSPRESDYKDAKPLAEELIDTLLDLLFYIDFTIPKIATAKGNISYSIWQSGVGCNSAMGSNKEMENNRCEILRLLLTLTGKAMYMPSGKWLLLRYSLAFADRYLGLLPVQGVKAITYITTCPDKQAVLTLLCSLLNTVCIRYSLESIAMCSLFRSRLSNTTLRRGEFRTITSSGKIRSRF